MEAKIEKIENYMNGSYKINEKRWIGRKNNLENLCRIISQPHEIDCKVKWNPIPEDEINDPLITRDLYKKSKIDVNK